MSELVKHMPLLQRLIDNIALLDVLLAFAESVSEAPSAYCRPTLYQNGPLAIAQVRPGIHQSSTYLIRDNDLLL